MAKAGEDEFFGLEVMRKVAEPSIKRKEDHLVVLLHWMLQKEAYRCIGTGDAREVSGDEPKTELLPDGWNTSDTYLLRYTKDDQLYLLRISKADNDVIFNFIRSKDMRIVSTMVSVNDVDEDGVVDKAAIYKKFFEQLLKPFITSKEKKTEEKPQKVPTVNDPGLRVGPPSRDFQPQPVPILSHPYGARDLDPFGLNVPFGPQGGGMIFPGPNSRHLPRYAGVRYDPMNPLARRIWNGSPDPDELPPPGFPFHDSEGRRGRGLGRGPDNDLGNMFN